MIQNIGADGGVHSRGERDLQLGADAVALATRTGSRQRFAIELEERAETADRREHAAAKRLARHRGNAPLGFVGNGNVYACVGIAHEDLLVFLRARGC